MGYDILTQSYRCVSCGTVSREADEGSVWRLQEQEGQEDILIHADRIECSSCGAEAVYDTERQAYVCAYCGTVTPLQEKAEPAWKNLQAESWSRVQREEEIAECTGCGAKILFKKDEASEKCHFCGGNLVRSEIKDTAELPELILPFVLTEEEAKNRLRNWVKGQKSSRDTRRIEQHIKELKGYYLPYRLIRGPLCGTASRNLEGRDYQFRGFLDHAVVNASGQLDNAVLDAAEPFDLSELKPFEYGYIGGHRVKLGDVSPTEIRSRTLNEAKEAYRPFVAKALHNSDVYLQLETGELKYLQVLLPMYILEVGSYLTVVNGQTGRISSASRKKDTSSRLWILEPGILTLLAVLITGYFFGFWLYPMVLMGVIAGLIFFSVYGDGRHGIYHRVILTGEKSRAKRDGGKLVLEEGKDLLKNAFPSDPVFYEKEGDREARVEIRFYTFGRLLTVFLKLAVLIFLPVILAVIINRGIEGVSILSGAAWYIVTGFVAILYCTRGLRWDIFNHPIFYEILPDGKRKLFGSRASRKLSILSLFQLETRENRKALGGIWIGMLAFIIFLLLGSALAMIY